jgi:hypothetical protein
MIWRNKATTCLGSRPHITHFPCRLLYAPALLSVKHACRGRVDTCCFCGRLRQRWLLQLADQRIDDIELGNHPKADCAELKDSNC